MTVNLGKRMQAEVALFEKAWRDQFAILALQGMLQSAPVCDRTKIDKKKWCEIAYEWADAMMEARWKKPKRK